MKYRAEIDGLRALAVIPVILFHAGFVLFSGGFVGVDVFFVISGYLITTILIEDIENNQFSIISFYERRARRILPALFFIMFICIPFALILMLPSQVEYFSRSLIAVSLFVSNILFWRESGYFDAAAEEKPLLHTWSLAVEEQYYLLFPIFLMFAWRFGKNRVFWMIVIMASVSLIISEWGWRNQPNANFYLAPTRAWELFAGSISAFIVQKHGVKKNNLFALFGLVAILFSIFVYDKSTPFPSIYSLVPILGVVLIILYADRNTLTAKLLSTKIFVGLGLISYSAYLWHQPLFVFARFLNHGMQESHLMAALFFVSIFLAYLTWKYIENPMRRKDLLNQKRIFQMSIFGMLFFCIIGFTGYKTNGFENYILNDSELVSYKSLERSSEENCANDISSCVKIADAKDKKSILLLGDSNAYHFSKGLKEIADEHQFSYIQLTKGACMPLSSNFYLLERSPIASKRCANFNLNIIDSISKLTNKIDVVIISSAWLSYYYGANLFEKQVYSRDLPNISEIKLSINGIDEIPLHQRKKVFESYFDNIHDILHKKARKIIVVGPLPPAITSFSKKNSFWDSQLISSNEYYTETSELNDLLLKKFSKNNFLYIDLPSLLCDKKTCKIRHNELFLYGDPTHFSDYGQSFILKPVLKEILKNDL
ncbi:acyltransferase [Gammaproteobacteria bacterium]|nr:acyltransferase [Gammaproteobacteria bacterium]